MYQQYIRRFYRIPSQVCELQFSVYFLFRVDRISSVIIRGIYIYRFGLTEEGNIWSCETGEWRKLPKEELHDYVPRQYTGLIFMLQ
jgi:hypothetical protein